MSTNPNPVSEATAPFVPVTTPNIERANRLLSVRTNPGFNEILRLSQELVEEAITACNTYPGWDMEVRTTLFIRQQVAKQHHDALLAKIREAIEIGKAEMREHASTLPAKTAAEALEQGDYVRTEVMKQLDEYESRPAGSF